MSVDSNVQRDVTEKERQCLLVVRRHLTPTPRIHYIDHSFEVPTGVSQVELALSFHKEKHAQIFVSLHDPNGFRGNRMRPSARGDVRLELWVAADSASEGAIPGPLPAGTWTARVDIEGLSEETTYQLEVYATFGTVVPPLYLEWPADHVIKAEGGWYKGELHAHSTESDGQYPVETVVQAAIDAGLDFLALTEHFTHSHWWKLASLQNDSLALLRSYEVTSHQGHANLHGLTDWVDVFVDRPGWSMDQVADAVHRQGGLFCVNHPFSGDLGWRAYEFDWDKADLLEIYHNLEGPNNNFHLPLWDHHLRLGRRLVGVGGTDSHDPFEGLHRLGQLVTWIEAPKLSEQGILEGLRRGRVYVSRGPELRFVARTPDGQQAEMWETLVSGQKRVHFEVQVRSEQALRLFVLKNGYPFTVLPVLPHSEWQYLHFEDVPQSPAYYRLEIHSIHPLEPYSSANWRDFSTMQALSNPIWILP